ncbi:MAG: glycoside hydrolase family 16 protein [Myxococcota bacterium]
MQRRLFQHLFLLVTVTSLTSLTACSGTDSSGTGGSGATGGTGGGGTGGTPVVDCDAEIGFEDGCGPFALENFAGGASAIIDNPDPSGINTTAKVLQLQKFEDDNFGGSSLTLAETVDWSRGTAFVAKVWSSRPVNLLFKLEGSDIELENVQTDSSAWEEVCFDFAGQTDVPDATGMTFIFDLGIVGKADSNPTSWTFYVDGIRQADACAPREEVTYELIFEDEFDSGEQPSAATWNFETGYGVDDSGWGNNEWQLYTSSTDNVRLEDGNLVIQALCPVEPCGIRDGTVTSGRITTQDKFEFRYGKVEARIKPPVGKGAWPAFWALGANFPEIGWPVSGEIDFMEAFNAFSSDGDRMTHFTMHWCDDSNLAPAPCEFDGGWTFLGKSLTLEESLGDDFHIFAAEWDETKVVGSIDGVEYYIRSINPETMAEFQREFFLLLNVAMGGTLGSNNQAPNGNEVFPQTMLVDWVRVYQRVD